MRIAGVDEIHVGRLGYLTVFHDSERFATPGKEAATFNAFIEDFQAHGGNPPAIETVSMDMSKAFQSGAQQTLPQAKLCFDPFHLVKLAGEALDKVRRAEAKNEPELKGLCWATRNSAENWRGEQIQAMHWLQRSGLKTARAWRLKEQLRDILG
ncbi:MAG TPA: transposase, partial [Levilinea sp.]|nr:transposase [Levilinea sp.]